MSYTANMLHTVAKLTPLFTNLLGSTHLRDAAVDHGEHLKEESEGDEAEEVHALHQPG